MTMQNSLNVSELLKRLGVVGDSKGSAPLLEDLRLAIQIADLSQLVPPVSGAIGGTYAQLTSGVTTRNVWVLESNAPGGLTIKGLHTGTAGIFIMWTAAANPIAGGVSEPVNDLAFEQTAVSRLITDTVTVLTPPSEFLARGPNLLTIFDGANWIGPGQFFVIQSLTPNVTDELISIVWKEYPAMINP